MVAEMTAEETQEIQRAIGDALAEKLAKITGKSIEEIQQRAGHVARPAPRRWQDAARARHCWG